jgi:membrane associated rhomboid family serine protease
VVAWLGYSLVYVIAKITTQEWLFDIVRINMELPSGFGSFIFKPWTLVTYFFLPTQTSLFHILFNMLWFYWCGKIIQDLVGSSKILGIYVWGGISGGLLYLIAYNTIPYFIGLGPALLVGASASVMAVVVGAATLAPNYSFNLMFIGRVKMIHIGLFYVGLSIISIAGSNAGGEIAHLGGALAGYFFIKQLQKGNDMSKPVFAIVGFFNKLFKPSPKMKVSHKKKTKGKSSKNGGVPQAEIDIILDKISQSGYESLTKEEKNKLFSASQKKD